MSRLTRDQLEALRFFLKFLMRLKLFDGKRYSFGYAADYFPEQVDRQVYWRLWAVKDR